MGLFQKAVETYDHMASLVGVESEERSAVLAPIGFITTGVQVVITVTEEGEFISAELADSKGKTHKSEKKIIIPVTENSAGRTSSANTTPHPLCDKMLYMTPQNKESYDAYLQQLRDWCNSAFSCQKIKAILVYVEKGSIQRDVPDGVKKEDFVAWRVRSSDCSEPEEVWKSPSVITAYEGYCQSKAEASPKKELCYVSGEFTTPAKQHLKGVVASFGSAKLISANDNNNFTYRGRFRTDAEALTVGFLSSQKAHNALKWVVANYGVSFGNGGKWMICWNPKGKKNPDPLASLFQNLETDEKPTPTNYRDILAKVVLGYKQAWEPDDETVTAVFDAATPGRLSVCYYSEMQAYDFSERLRFWDETTAWLYPDLGVTSPTLRDISDAAYGVPRTAKGAQGIETDKNVFSGAMQRLLLCRLERSPFPADMMRCAVQKCSSLQLYEEQNRRKQLFTTCAIIRKYWHDRYKEEWNMALEPEKENRSYQFGRLLAVLEKAERDAFDEGEKREPNAMRMQALFVKRPMYAATIIIEQLKNAYYPRLTVGSRNYYEKLIGDIMCVLSTCADSERDKPLGEEYLMGYYLQKNALYAKRGSKEEEQ